MSPSSQCRAGRSFLGLALDIQVWPVCVDGRGKPWGSQLDPQDDLGESAHGRSAILCKLGLGIEKVEGGKSYSLSVQTELDRREGRTVCCTQGQALSWAPS